MDMFEGIVEIGPGEVMGKFKKMASRRRRGFRWDGPSEIDD